MPMTALRRIALVVASLAAVAGPGEALAVKAADYLIVNEAAPSFGLDEKGLNAVWKQEFPPQIPRLYPPRKYGFLAVIDGGIDPKGLCVVAARATMLPRSGKVLQYKPVRSAVVFDAQRDSTREQCTALAKTKLNEAIEGMLAGIVASK